MSTILSESEINSLVNAMIVYDYAPNNNPDPGPNLRQLVRHYLNSLSDRDFKQWANSYMVNYLNGIQDVIKFINMMEHEGISFRRLI